MNMTEPNLSTRVIEAMRLIDEAIANSAQQLDQAPDNPAIKRVPGPTRGFVMSSSAMFASDNWTAFFHDWKAQYEFAKELLEKRRFSVLRKLLDGKSFEDRTFAPAVIEKITVITGDLDFTTEAASTD
jgi:hypothetical protein